MQDIKKYTEEAKTLGIRNYTGSPEEDLMLSFWWAELKASGELEEIFGLTPFKWACAHTYQMGTFFRFPAVILFW